MLENLPLHITESPNLTRLEGAAEFSLSAEERRQAVEDMRDFGRRRAIDKCLEEYGVDVIIGPADSEIDDYYSAAGKSSRFISTTLATQSLSASTRNETVDLTSRHSV